LRPWTSAEEEALRVLAPLGAPAIALAFDRSEVSVRHKAARLHVSTRRRSYGTELAQSCSEAALRRVRQVAEANLCPACVKRPIAVNKTGLCGVCHMNALRLVHETQLATLEAQRGLWGARAKLCRRRKSMAKGTP
jgi:hypothetical protein